MINRTSFMVTLTIVATFTLISVAFVIYYLNESNNHSQTLIAKQQQALLEAQREMQILASNASTSAALAASEADQASTSMALADQERKDALAAQNRAASNEQSSSKSYSQLPSDELSTSLMMDTMSRIARVKCAGDNYISIGSGSIQGREDGTWIVYTNLHVLLPNDTNVICSVSVPQPPDYSPGNTYAATITASSSSTYPDVDLAILTPTGNIKEKFKPYALGICTSGVPQIGDKVTVFGYPTYGGSTLTVTDGIVSGIVATNFGDIYKTSAKIDSGNSGGLAIDVTHECGIGIPSWAVAGSFEGLGLIQSWTMMGYTK